jgi:hypothetical protein
VKANPLSISKLKSIVLAQNGKVKWLEIEERTDPY